MRTTVHMEHEHLTLASMLSLTRQSFRPAVGGARAESTVPHSQYPLRACPICVHRQCLSMAGMVKTWPPPADSKNKSYDSKVNSSPLNPTLIGHASQPSPCAIPPTDVGWARDTARRSTGGREGESASAEHFRALILQGRRPPEAPPTLVGG